MNKSISKSQIVKKRSNSICEEQETYNQWREIETNKRVEYSSRLLQKYPDKIPIIIQCVGQLNFVAGINNKFLIPRSFTIMQLKHILKRRLDLTSNQSLFMFNMKNKKMITDKQSVEVVYNQNMDVDGFLYLSCSKENVYG